mmetsp:Transcript_29080/g.81380  ORF Transcript_29080/g.81380 Transcript_29080/m.81380 type:complete len:212 (+) Transcript_29080:38-673(+)
MMGRGALILLEGVDRSGKSTQCRRVVESLQALNVPTKRVVFPDRSTEIGKLIDLFLRKEKEYNDQAIHLLYSANRWEMVESIQADLKNGVNVIMDRYAFSGVAYTAAKGLDLEWCKGPDAGLPVPDAVIFLQISPEEQQKRGEWGAERYEKAEFQQKVTAVFEQLRKEANPSWYTVDGAQAEDRVEEEILNIVNKTIKLCSAGETVDAKLW